MGGSGWRLAGSDVGDGTGVGVLLEFEPPEKNTSSDDFDTYLGYAGSST